MSAKIHRLRFDDVPILEKPEPRFSWWGLLTLGLCSLSAVCMVWLGSKLLGWVVE